MDSYTDKSIRELAQPTVDKLIEAARKSGGGSEALLRACRATLNPRYSLFLPATASWDGVISVAAEIRNAGIHQPISEATDAAITAKAICLAVDELKSKKRKRRKRVVSPEKLDWSWPGKCSLCQRTAPGILGTAQPYFCSVHAVGSTPYKRATRHAKEWRSKCKAMYDGFPIENRPWNDFEDLPFRDWLTRWFPLTARQYLHPTAKELVSALDDENAPAAAREDHQRYVLRIPQRLVTFLVDVECWLMIDQSPRRGLRGKVDKPSLD